MSATAAAPSPIAPPTRFADPERTSPTANTPGMLDSSDAGMRPATGPVIAWPLKQHLGVQRIHARRRPDEQRVHSMPSLFYNPLRWAPADASSRFPSFIMKTQ